MDYCTALKEVLKHNIIWIEAQSCSGETVMILRSGCEGLEELFFHSSPVKFVSLVSEEKSGKEMLESILNMNDFVLVIEGAIPTNDSLCTFGGYPCTQVIKLLAEKANSVVAVGSCAVNGGILRETGSKGVKEILTDKKVLEVPGCPASPQMIVAMVYSALGERYGS
ncbi:Ni,Fe-hydrogenase I small subunit [Stygiolobus sp. CP850M]|uniref:NADH-quinone oxidoreductase subunit B family protein n=1 Tax=unclassified Stygiolobus TaxID=2824672 RepID=UPI00307D6D96